MEQKTKVDESLLDQLLNDFIYEQLVPQYRLQFTEFLFDYNQFDFYLKFKDKLIPHPYLKGSSYCFNSELCLRLSRGNLDNYFLKGREAFFAYLLTELSLSESYLKYLNRLPGVPMPLFEKLKEDHLTARKSGDKTSTALLGTLINDIKESILKGLSMAQYGILNPTDEQVLAIIKQYVSKNIETTDIAGPSPKMEAELAILQSYQPTLLTDSELVGIYVDFKTNFEGNEKALCGAFMKHLTQNYAYRYEGVSRKQRTTSTPPKNLEELIKPIHTILLDMDEVLVNFKQILIDCNPHYDVENMYEIAAVFGDKEALISEWISNAIKKKGFEYAKPLWFYHTVMDKLLPYWTEKGINVEILSSLSSNPANQTYIGTQKLRWLSNNNCHLKFTFVKGARNKQNHAKPGVLLIDDYYRNVTQFIKAGGYAILANPKDQESSIYNKLRLLGLTPD